MLKDLSIIVLPFVFLFSYLQFFRYGFAAHNNGYYCGKVRNKIGLMTLQFPEFHKWDSIKAVSVSKRFTHIGLTNIIHIILEDSEDIVFLGSEKSKQKVIDIIADKCSIYLEDDPRRESNKPKEMKKLECPNCSTDFSADVTDIRIKCPHCGAIGRV